MLEVLDKKVNDIDEEVALLHELKEIVLEFILQIKQADFAKDSDVKQLYDKAKEIEKQIINVDYSGNPANLNRLLEVTENLNKITSVKIVRLPKCRMLTSGLITDMDKLNRFDSCWSKISHLRKDDFYARDFMWSDNDKEGMIWWYALEDWMTEENINTEGYEIINFEGGLYGVGIAMQNDGTEQSQVINNIKKWAKDHDKITLDEHQGHRIMMNVVSPESGEIFGDMQNEIFVPIKLKNYK